jgi:hypothetical protein
MNIQFLGIDMAIAFKRLIASRLQLDLAQTVSILNVSVISPAVEQVHL